MIALLSIALGQTSADVQHFWPSGGTQGFATVPSARQLRAMGGSFDAWANYAHRPLQRSRVTEDGLVREQGAIDSLFAVHLRGAFGATDWLEIRAGMPVLQAVSTDQAVLDFGGAQAILATGDLVLGASLSPLGEEVLGIAVEPFVSLPTGSRSVFLSRGEPTFGARLVLSKTLSQVHLAGHAGYRLVPTGGYLDGSVGIDDELLYGGGLGFQLVPDRVRFNLELTGSQVVGKARELALDSTVKDALHAPLELLGDVRVDLDSGVGVVFGGGPGLSPSVGTPAFRAFVGLGWHTPGDRDLDGDGLVDRYDDCPEQPEDVDRFEDDDGCPDRDNDRDGVPDVSDRCPLVPEDPDGFQDADGCPDPDNDLDGIPDHADRCPVQPEDLDGIEDFDGCPDYAPMVLDTDRDGIQDAQDQCIGQPEDYDGFLDLDGCPDPDNDVDYIPDVVDACPNEPETLNGNLDEDGCPDDALVQLTQEQIVILEQVHFLSGKAEIMEDSFPVLFAVLKVLEDHPEIRRVKIEGHTDSRGSNSYNLQLSTERAFAIQAFLVGNGVAPERLDAEGFGEFSPLVPNDTPENMERNRRVEFHILEQW